jgi:DNA-binding response OmpR family regulator
LLRLSGHTVVTAFNADRIMDTATSFHPDVVLLDLGLGGAHDGLDVARWLREDPRLGEMLLVALTGRCDEDIALDAAAAGFDYYLLKPVGFDDLEAVIATLDEARATAQRNNSIAG